MILTSIVALVTFKFLQLWLTQDSWKKLAEIALNLAVIPQQTDRDTISNKLFISDIKIQGKNYKSLGYVDAKIFSNAQHIYETTI